MAISTIRALAGLNIVMVLDDNESIPLIQRRYKQEVASCMECLRLLRDLEKEVAASLETARCLGAWVTLPPSVVR